MREDKRSLAWETVDRWRDIAERLRWENHRLRAQLESRSADAETWRQMYEEAIRYVGIFHPMLAEIVEEDAFRLWEMDVK